MKKVFGGHQFYQGEKMLSMNQLVDVMQPNELAYEHIKSAQSTNTLATIIGGAGGFRSVNIKAKQAVDTYNSGLQKTSSYWNKSEFKLLMTGNGVGLILRF